MEAFIYLNNQKSYSYAVDFLTQQLTYDPLPIANLANDIN